MTDELLPKRPNNKRLFGPYDKAKLKEAYTAALNGMPVSRAAKIYKVPRSTLRDRVDGNVGLDALSGPERIFSPDEEDILVSHVKYMANIGYGYTKTELQYLGLEYAKCLVKTLTSNQRLSDRWYYGLVKRRPDLNMAQKMKKPKSEVMLDRYFAELKNILTSNDLLKHPERIIVIDETGVVADDVQVKGSTPLYVRSLVTVVGGASADGKAIPPFYVFPGKRWSKRLLSGASAGSTGILSSDAESRMGLLETYVMEHLAQCSTVQDDAVTLVLYNRYKSHLSLTLKEWARGHNVILYVLPPLSSEVEQPFNVEMFGPFMSQYYSECHKLLEKNPGTSITSFNVAKLTHQSYLKAFTTESITAAFCKSGIYPLDRSKMGSSVTNSVCIGDSLEIEVQTGTPEEDESS